MNATHPDEETLRKFGLGRLSDTKLSDSVTHHLDRCGPCRSKVAELSGGAGRKTPDSTGKTGDSGYVSAEMRAAPEPKPASDVPPELLALTQYAVEKELGRGGMGVVYLARNTDLDRLEVLKVMRPAGGDRTDRADAVATARFIREIQAAAKLDHPNVVKAYALHRPGDLLVFAMEYAPGVDLAKLVKDRGPLAVDVACSYVLAAANGLQHAHEQKMVHRDIKPANIVLTKIRGKLLVKILDFGLAKVSSETDPAMDLTGDGQMMGTPHYMAPEQALDSTRADIRADIYSLGCTLYHLLTGRPPYDGRNIIALIDKHRFDAPPSVRAARPDVPEAVAAAITRMMAKDPAQRFPTPADVAKVLRPFTTAAAKPAGPMVSPIADTVSEPSVHAQETILPGSVPRFLAPPAAMPEAVPAAGRRRPRWPWVAVVAALVLGGAAAIAVLVPRPAEDVVTPGPDRKPSPVDIPAPPVPAETAPTAVPPARPTKSVPPPKRQVPVPTPRTVPAFVPEPGYTSLFDGRDLTGWVADDRIKARWTVADGVLIARAADLDDKSYLLSARDYGDYTLRFEFRVSVDNGSLSFGGVTVRAELNERIPLATGERTADHPTIRLSHPGRLEQDGTGVTHWVVGSDTYVKPKKRFDTRVDVWHTAEVTVRGGRCTFGVDNTSVVDDVFDKKKVEIAGFEPGLERSRGRVGFHIGLGTVAFRNIRIRIL